MIQNNAALINNTFVIFTKHSHLQRHQHLNRCKLVSQPGVCLRLCEFTWHLGGGKLTRQYLIATQPLTSVLDGNTA